MPEIADPALRQQTAVVHWVDVRRLAPPAGAALPGVHQANDASNSCIERRDAFRVASSLHDLRRPARRVCRQWTCGDRNGDRHARSGECRTHAAGSRGRHESDHRSISPTGEPGGRPTRNRRWCDPNHLDDESAAAAGQQRDAAAGGYSAGLSATSISNAVAAAGQRAAAASGLSGYCRSNAAHLSPHGSVAIRSAPQQCPSPAPAASAAKPIVDLQFTGPDRTYVGGKVTFDLILINRSDAPATGLTIIDRFDDGLVHAAGVNPIQKSLESLAPRETRGLSITFKVAKPGRLCNLVELTGDGGLTISAQACVESEAVRLGPTPVMPNPATPNPNNPKPTGPAPTGPRRSDRRRLIPFRRIQVRKRP